MDDLNLVLTNLHPGVLQITLNHPRVNALNVEMVSGLLHAFKQAERDPDVRCVLLSGHGGNFSAGHDLNEMSQSADTSYRSHLQRTYNPLIMQMRRLEKPVVAAIAGAAAGAGLGIALACDLRIAADNARFVVGFGAIGLAPDSGVSLLLPSLVGLARAAELTFSNAPLSAEQALGWGLVNRVVPAAELDEQAFAWIRQLAQGPVHAMGLAKRAFNRAVLGNLEDVLDYEGHIQEIASKALEHKEGLAAFLEKRPPRFEGL